MCSFIILLLLLGCSCRNNGCEEYNSECSRDDNNRRNDNWRNESRDSRRSEDNNCRCNDRDDRDDYRRNDDNDYRRGSRSNNDCSCSACEDAASDNSPIKEREDIWSPYLNASSGRQK